MLKSIEFLRGKSRGRVGGGTKAAPLVPVILCLVPRILWKQGTNLVNKFALLLNKCWLREDSRNESENDWCRGRWLSAFCMFFKYPSPEACASPSPSRGEGSRLLRRCTPRNDVNSLGRSMIEMLGVLATIGVLSVGGIAGYSKAMEQFKVNKAIDEYTALTYGVVEHLDEIRKSFRNRGNYFISDFLTAVNLIPDNWQHNGEAFKDSYGNHVQLFYSSSYDRLVYDIYIGGLSSTQEQGTVSSAFSAKFCMKLFENLVVRCIL